MKKAILFLSCFIVVFSLNGCTNNKNKSSSKAKASNKYDLIVKKAKSSSLEPSKENLPKEVIKNNNFMTDSIHSLEDIKRLTEIGVQGIVVSSENYVIINSPYTKITFYINKVLYGDQSLVGTEIVIYELGGIISNQELGMKEKFPNMSESELSKKVILVYDGVPNSNVGTEQILFLIKTPKSYLDVDTDFYSTFGSYLTRFDKSENNYYKMPVPSYSLEYFPNDEELEKINSDVNSMLK